MRKTLTGVLVFAFIAAVAPVMTVTNGQPDGSAHPYVGNCAGVTYSNRVDLRDIQDFINSPQQD